MEYMVSQHSSSSMLLLVYYLENNSLSICHVVWFENQSLFHVMFHLIVTKQHMLLRVTYLLAGHCSFPFQNYGNMTNKDCFEQFSSLEGSWACISKIYCSVARKQHAWIWVIYGSKRCFDHLTRPLNRYMLFCSHNTFLSLSKYNLIQENW